MKILFLADFIPPRHIGGPGKRNFEVAVRLQQLGHEVFFITSCQNKEQEIEETKEGIKIFNVYSQYPPSLRDYLNIYNPLVVRKVKKIIKEVKPDVVHADIIHTHLSYACLKIARTHAKAVFLHSRDCMLFNYGKLFPKEKKCGWQDYRVGWFDNLKKGKKRFNPFRNFFIRRYVKYADKIFAVSNELAEALRQNKIYNVSVLYNGFPVPIEEPEFCAFEFKRILLAGRLNGAKGVYALLDAFPLVKSKVPDAQLVLVGADNEEKERINNYIPEKHLEKDDLKILGWVEEDRMKLILKSSSLICSPSLCFDTLLAGANFEAAAYKKPIVTTCFGGAKEFVLDGKTGYVINPFDKEELANRIIDILTNEEKARQFGEAAYQRLKQKFSIDEYVRKLLGWYGQYAKQH